MASYHLTAQPVKRSEGRSVVAMAAYRAGVKLKDERRGTEADYRRRHGIVHAEIIAPEGSAAFLRDRERLWNYVESIERRVDSQLAREINLALPHELTDAQRLALVRQFIRDEFVSEGMVADFAIHRPVHEKGDDPRNFHAHILLTMRQAQKSGLRSVKTRDWNSDEKLVKWRAAWATLQNEALRKQGHKATVDHRSLAVQRAEAKARGDLAKSLMLDREPEIHVGPKAKKAGLAGPPKSRDRQVGPARKDGGDESRKRTLSYSKIDRGSRGEFNISRLQKNAEGSSSKLDKLQRQSVRFRQRMRRYDAVIARYEAAPKKKPWKPKTDAMDLFVGKKRYDHIKKRRKQVAWWVSQLDDVINALLGIRESQFIRRTMWANRMKRWRPLFAKPSRGGGRQRSRSLPG